MRTLLLFLLAGSLSTCYTTSQFTSIDGKVIQASEEEASCEFQIVTTLPQEKMRELGMIDLDCGLYGCTHDLRTLTGFRNAITSDVCAAKGDLVVATVNGFGIYIKGVVFQKI